MNVQERLEFATGFLEEHCLEVLRTKGREYTGGSVDALSNFKDISKATGVPPVTVAYTFLFKHLASIASFVKDPTAELSEPIESRLGDAINYMLIIGALLDEERRDARARIDVTAYGDEDPQYIYLEDNPANAPIPDASHIIREEDPWPAGTSAPLDDYQAWRRANEAPTIYADTSGPQFGSSEERENAEDLKFEFHVKDATVTKAADVVQPVPAERAVVPLSQLYVMPAFVDAAMAMGLATKRTFTRAELERLSDAELEVLAAVVELYEGGSR